MSTGRDEKVGDVVSLGVWGSRFREINAKLMPVVLTSVRITIVSGFGQYSIISCNSLLHM